MLTKQEKQTLIDILNSVQIRGNRETIRKTMEELDALIEKIRALPTQPAPAEQPARKPRKV